MARFQSFKEAGGPAEGAERASLLRAELRKQDLAGFIVPRADDHQNEYVPAGAERLLWLTGFSGSAGLAIVLLDRATLFVDGRYTVQATEQTDPQVYSVEFVTGAPPSQWLEKALKAGDRIGFDPWLLTAEMVRRLTAAAEKVDAKLVPVDNNPIDLIWTNRPPPPTAPVEIYPLEFAGEPALSKIEKLQQRLDGFDSLVISDAHNVAWLLNIRGGDVAHTPLPLCFAFAPRHGRPTLFINEAKLNPTTRAALAPIVSIQSEAGFTEFLAELVAGKRVIIDAATGSYELTRCVERAGGVAVIEPDPITLLKARKNDAELAGARAAHLRDGVAVTRFLAWFDESAKKEKLTEISAAEKLEDFRAETNLLRDTSFPTISAAGLHAALPHYRVSDSSNLTIRKGLFLIDSGAQYLDGTTDITRTVVVGRASRTMRDRFTRVLKGHIAIARLVFCKGATGAHIDILARQALWRIGLDFEHGVGHGIGAYLSVHEGPQRIAKTGSVALEPGMIISNEPGYYSQGKFGVRIENLVIVTPRDIKGAEREMLGFETISLAPIDLRAIESDLLDRDEKAWLNDYHARVRRELSPHLDKATRTWLKRATRRI